MWFNRARQPTPCSYVCRFGRMLRNPPTPPVMNLAKRKPCVRRVTRFGLLLTAYCALQAYGQETSNPSASAAAKKNASEDEAIVLSPFVVNSEADKGWRATNTLAGTRLRTDLKDIASPISVMTPELLKDVGATNLQQALLYSVNVENENQYTPYDVNGNAQADTTVNRVRGIAAGTTTRGFFQTRFRMDTYNTDGLTIASGPNSILFGIGSPAGIIDSNPIQANSNRFSGSIGNVIDNNDTWRFTLDVNAPIIKNKLAVRAAFLKQDQQTWMKPEYDKEDRQYVTMRADPFPGTTIRASYEHMKDKRIRAQQGLITDQVSQWIALGKPLYDPNSERWTFDHGSTWVSRPDLRNWRTDRAGDWAYNNRVFIQSGNQGGAESLGLIWKNVGGTSFDGRNQILSYNSFRDDSVIDPTVNYFGTGNVTRLEGEDKSLVIEQKITDEIFLQLAYNKETHDRWQQNSYRYGISSIKADVNYYLPYNSANPQVTSSTTLNPNRGRMYTEGQSLVMISPSEMETERAMLTYSPDFRKHGMKWLGHYNLGAMFERTNNQTIQVQNWLLNSGSMQVVPNKLDVGSNGIVTRSYLDIPGLGGDPYGVKYPSGTLLPPWSSEVLPNNGSSTPLAKIKSDALMGVMQAFLLDDNLVLTAGVRKDTQDVHNYVYTNDDRLSGNLTDDNTSAAAAAAGLTGGLGVTSDSGVTKTYGVVYHTPLKWLSLVYNRSNTFNPQNHLVDLFHKPLEASTGVGQDYGVMMNLLEDKLSLKLTAYKNTSEHAQTGQNYTAGPGGFGDYWGLAGFFYWGSTWGELTSPAYTDAMASAWGLPTKAETLTHKWAINDIMNYSYNLVFTRSEVSKGYEMELYYKPTPNWDVRLTAAKADSKNNVYYPEMLNFIDQALPIWTKYFPLIQDWNGWNSNPVPAGVDANWKSNPDTVGYQYYHNIKPIYTFIKQLQGRADDRARQWRVNLLTTYHFTEGSLKGFSVGGAWRWRSAAAIGYYGMQNPDQPNDPTAFMPDISRPISGSSESFIDAWVGYERDFTVAGKKLGHSVQLNVQNVFNHSPIVVTGRHYDLLGTPSGYQKLDPIKITLTNTFSF